MATPNDATRGDPTPANKCSNWNNFVRRLEDYVSGKHNPLREIVSFVRENAIVWNFRQHVGSPFKNNNRIGDIFKDYAIIIQFIRFCFHKINEEQCRYKVCVSIHIILAHFFCKNFQN